MTRVELIEDFLENLNTEIDVAYFVDADQVENYDDIYHAIEDNDGFYEDVIYYSVAIDYLKEHDPSLNESLSIACEHGYSPDNLNSEVLASLLKSQNVREEFAELEGEITEFFDELNSKEFCEECEQEQTYCECETDES